MANDKTKHTAGFTLTPFQLFCIRWSVFFDKTTDKLSPNESVFRYIQLTFMVVTGMMTMASVLKSDNKKALESLTYFTICAFFLAIAIFAIRTKRFNRRMLLMVEEEFPSYDRPVPEELRRKLTGIRKSYYDFTKNVVLSYLTLVAFEVQATALVPLSAARFTSVKLGTQSTSMVVMWFPGDTSQVLIYALSFTTQYTIVVVVKTIITGTICSFTFFVTQMLTEYRILSAYVEHAIEIVEYDRSTGLNTETKLLDHIRNCVKLHNRLIDFMGELNESYNYIILVELMFSTLYFCLSAFNMIFVGNKFTIVKGLLTLSNYLAELFIFCMYGSMVEDSHINLLRATYGSAWYAQTIRCRKSLMMIMSRSQVPLQLTVGKVFLASLPLFQSVIKVSYSGVNALRAANAK